MDGGNVDVPAPAREEEEGSMALQTALSHRIPALQPNRVLQNQNIPECEICELKGPPKKNMHGVKRN